MKKSFVLLLSGMAVAAACFGQVFPKSSEVAPELLGLLRDETVLPGHSLVNGKRAGQEANERRLSQAQAGGDKAELIAAANALAWTYAAKGLTAKAAGHFDLAASAFRDMGKRYGEALVLAEKAYLYFLKNNYSSAFSSCEQSLLADTSSSRLSCFTNYIKGRSLSAQGLHGEAMTAYGSALQQAQKAESSFMAARTRLRLAEECIRDNRDAAAGKHLSEAQKLLRKTNDKSGLATVFAYQGILSHLAGHHEKALDEFNRSQELMPRIVLLKLIRDTYLKLLSSSEVRNDADKRGYYNRMYYQYRDSVQLAGEEAGALGNRFRTGADEAPDFNALLARKKNPYNALARPQLEFNKKLNEAELKRLKAEEALALVNKENEAEIRERETHIARLQKEMAEQELALSKKELSATRQRQLIVVLLISSAAVVIITLVLLSRYRQKKRSHEDVRKAFEELSATHEQLKLTQDQLVHSEKMASLGQLTAGIAHEIQNPLNFVNNFSEVSAELLHEIEATSTEEQKPALANIRQNLAKITFHGKRADSIIKSMLLHSRNGVHEKQPTDLNQMASEIIQLAYHSMRTREPGFSCSLGEQLDPALDKVSVVPQDMSRVLLNLFSNAFYAVAEKRKSAGPGYRPEVSVLTLGDGDGVLITVRDNGGGIEDSNLDRIFNPFFTTKPPGLGTGLGLSISYDIVTKSHNGTFNVDTRLGEYTQFTIRLPRT